MLRAQFTETIGGRAVAFALPLDGLRRVAAHEPRLYVLAQRIADRETTALPDVEAVLAAACGDDAAHVIECAGLERATILALRVLVMAITDESEDDPPGKGMAPSETTPMAPYSDGALIS